jgi:Flp pilus assembly protein TadG
MNASVHRRRGPQAGVATVEFALIAAGILFPLLIGIMEFGRIIFYWNAATEATRLGARLAVVCDLDDSAVKTRMTALFPVLDASDIQIAYEPAGCTATSCLQVRVSVERPEPEHTVLRDYRNRTTSPDAFRFLPTFPPFSTTLPRESMRSSFGPAGAEVANPVCE